jgi:NitT/TauT family transport system permease protein
MTKRKLIIIVFWMGLWQILSMVSKDKIFFVGPVDVIESLAGQLVRADFWISIASSMGKIGAGFLGAFLLGIVNGILAFRFSVIRELLSPIMSVIKSVPVASFVILALIWTGSKNLSIFIAFLVVLPIIYTSTISSLNSTDEKLLEMAEVFSMKGWYKAIAIYKPALMPYLISSCRVALGMAWKSGIAAEVIGVPALSIGERLYTSKIYIDTAGLFAWTLVIVLLSILTEKLFLILLRALDRAYPLDIIPVNCHKTVGTGLCASSGICKKPFFCISSINKSYGEQVVLEDYSLTLSSDGVYCLMGPSGRGKTTLLNILSGVVKPDEGDISDFDDLAVSEVFQEDRLQEALSPIRNVQIACRTEIDKESIIRELSIILPEDCLKKPVKELSGGMKRRTAICRAVMSQSDILIMDEPFTGLDKKSKLKSIEYIKENRKGRLLIVATHNEEDLELLRAQRLQLN